MGAPRIPPKPPWPHSIFLGLSCCSPCFRVADFPSPKFSCLPPQPFLRSSCLGEADGFEEVGDQHMRDASSIGRPFGHDESFNMGVYPGRGPALISRADMIILPSPITIDSFAFADNTFAVVVDVAPFPLSAIASEDPSTLSAGVSVHSAAGASVTGFVFIVFTVDSAPGPVTPTAMRDDASLKSPALHAPKLS